MIQLLPDATLYEVASYQINAAPRFVTNLMKWNKNKHLRWIVWPESEYPDEIRKINVIPENSGIKEHQV